MTPTKPGPLTLTDARIAAFHHGPIPVPDYAANWFHLRRIVLTVQFLNNVTTQYISTEQEFGCLRCGRAISTGWRIAARFRDQDITSCDPCLPEVMAELYARYGN